MIVTSFNILADVFIDFDNSELEYPTIKKEMLGMRNRVEPFALRAIRRSVSAMRDAVRGQMTVVKSRYYSAGVVVTAGVLTGSSEGCLSSSNLSETN